MYRAFTAPTARPPRYDGERCAGWTAGGGREASGRPVAPTTTELIAEIAAEYTREEEEIGVEVEHVQIDRPVIENQV